MVGAIFMAAIASRISVTWSSFNVTTGDKPGLSGGVVVGARAIGGWHCTISVIAIAKRGEGSERCLRSWVLGNTEVNGQDFQRGPMPLYIHWFRIIVRNGGPFSRGQRGTID
jgi:hypothetical protein